MSFAAMERRVEAGRVVATEVPKCEVCKSMEPNRSLCATCLNRNLERACMRTFVLPPGAKRVGPNAPRALYPGMPRAALRSVVDGCGHDISRPSLREMGTNVVVSCEAFLRHPYVGTSSPSGLTEYNHMVDVSPLEDGGRAHDTGAVSEDYSRQTNMDTLKSFPGGELTKVGDLAEERRHMLQMRKNLTVKIPGSAAAATTLRSETRQMSHVTHSVQRSRRSAALPKMRKWTVRPDAAAEAELMKRLLSDSTPFVKPPLVLPTCKIRPTPPSPISPPADPLWKRRCVPCPKTLRVQVTPVKAICV